MNPAARRKNPDLLRSDGAGTVAILREKLPDFFSQDLIAGRTQVDLITDKQRLDRFAILTKHVGTDVDVFCLRLRLKKVLHELIKLQNARQEDHARRTRFDGDKCDWDRRGVGPEDCEQLLERLKNSLWRCAAGEIVVAGINHDGRRLSRQNEPVGVSNAIGQARSAKSTIQHGVSGKILLKRFPKPYRRTAVKNDRAGGDRRLRQSCLEGSDL